MKSVAVLTAVKYSTTVSLLSTVFPALHNTVSNLTCNSGSSAVVTDSIKECFTEQLRINVVLSLMLGGKETFRPIEEFSHGLALTGLRLQIVLQSALCSDMFADELKNV